MHDSTVPDNSTHPSCPEGKYWISPHERRRIDKHGKVYIQHVKGYCCRYHSIFHKIADEEKLPLDHLYFALTIYGEVRGENDHSKSAIAWVIRNRLISNRWGESYQKIVTRKTQFSCWNPKDPNFMVLKYPGKDGSAADRLAWESCKRIMKEVRDADQNTNPIPKVCNYFSGEPKKKWQEKYFDLPDVPKFHFVLLAK
ncbi:MAG: cell wall hydrolase [Legionellaceae bacterium]|nr:cell wall hydrolase [Legionellaceae bacterium]